MKADAAAARLSPASSVARKSAPTFDWRTVFVHRTAIACLLLVVVHQSIVASSTFFLTRAISSFESGHDYLSDVCAYLIAMALPYLPGCASFVFLQKWINQSHHSLVKNFTTVAASHHPDYRNHSIRENVTSVLARNSFSVLKDYLSFIHDLISFSLNSLLSIVVIVFLLPAQLAAGYCLSLALCFVIVMALQKSITQASSHCEYAYLRYSGVLGSFWSNTILGNQHNEAIWRRQRESIGNTFYVASSRLEFLRQSGNVLLAAASLGPTIFLIVNIVRSDSVESSLVAALIVSLTRIFLIVNSLSTLVYRALDYLSQHARIKILLNAQAELTAHSDDAAATPVDVEINEAPVNSISEAKRLIIPHKFGRFTITGSNGSGKSTLLLALKREWGATCFLLPANYNDLAWEKEYNFLSTGQKLIGHLTEIFELEKIDYLLLDEWDANLDAENTAKIDTILSHLATSKIIVEVRHGRSQA